MPAATNTRPHHPVFDTCRDVVGIDLYRHNAFRVLGISVGATAQSAAKSQKLREMQQKLGMANGETHGSGALLPLPQAPDSDTVRRAGEALRDPISRFVNSFFWFWPTDGSTGPDGSLTLIAQGHPSVALASWQRYVTASPDSVVVRHNVAVLAHALALDSEAIVRRAPISPDHERSRWAYWQVALETWRGLLDAPPFWQHVKAVRDAADDPRLPLDIAHRFRDWLPDVLLRTTARVMLDTATRGADARDLRSAFEDAAAFFLPSAEPDGPSATARAAPHSSNTSAQLDLFARTLASAHWPRAELDQALEAELKPTIEQLREHAARVAKATPSTPRVELTDVLNALVRRCAVVEALLPPQSAHRGALVDTVVESLLEAGIAHGNADTRWSHWLLFNDTLLHLVRGAMLKDRLAKTGETLRSNAKGAERDKEFEEAKSALASGMAVDVELTGEGIRVPQVCTCCLGPAEVEKPYSYSWQETRVLQRVNRTVSFNFPLCRECASHASETSKKSFWLIALPVVGAGALGYLLGQIEDANGWAVAIGSTVAAVIGMFLLSTKIKLSPLEEKHACRGDSVRLQPAHAHNDVWLVTFSNPVYAHAFAQTNGFRSGAPRPSGEYKGTSALGGGGGVTRIVVLVVLSMIASGIAFAIASDGQRRSSWSGTPTPSRTPSRTPSTTHAPSTTSYPTRPAPSTSSSPRPSVPTWQQPVRADPNAATKALLASEIESGKARLRDLEDEVQTMERRLKSIQSEIDSYKSEIDGYESRSRYGGYVNQSAYKAALDAHNERVESYNALLGRYRSRFREYEGALESVNAKVDEYNRLIGR
ncbi:MAG: hypothetical protein IT435_02175 [Phycisphaerales bacterium]|nr:hypothetical protein [Phycisphaerales bacterium]